MRPKKLQNSALTKVDNLGVGSHVEQRVDLVDTHGSRPDELELRAGLRKCRGWHPRRDRFSGVLSGCGSG